MKLPKAVSCCVRCTLMLASGLFVNTANAQAQNPLPPLAPIVGPVQIAASYTFACAEMSDGTVRCWGLNGSAAQLGSDTIYDSNQAIPITGISNAVAVAVGGEHGCALINDGTVQCWGDNSWGELGNGAGNGTTFIHSATPVKVSGLAGPVSAIAAGDYHTCALLTDGKVQCWGQNTYWQLGNSTPAYSDTPVNVPLGGTALSISAGSVHNCAMVNTPVLIILPGGGIGGGGTETVAKCWGDNAFGELGIGTTPNLNYPTKVQDLSDVQSITAGYESTCAIAGSNAQLSCWGAGYLGNGIPGSPTLIMANYPTAVSESVPVSSVAVSADKCFVSNGAVQCWGADPRGELDDTPAGDSYVPVPTSITSTARSVVVGGDEYSPTFGFACVLSALSGSYFPTTPPTNTAVLCWGADQYGQTGNGVSQIETSSPQTVLGLVP